MIFEETLYSAIWEANVSLSPAHPSPESLGLPRLQTHSTLGAIKSEDAHWHLEPGLGVDFELSHSLLLHCGYQVVFANEQVFELLVLQPGLCIGRMPGRATPELFASNQTTETDGAFSFLQEDSFHIALHIQQQGPEKYFILCMSEGSREDCVEKITPFIEKLPETLTSEWNSQIARREKFLSPLPENPAAENTGLAIERLLGMIEPASGIFQGPWIRDPGQSSPALSFRLSCTLLPAYAIFLPERVPELLQTLLSLPVSEKGFWSETYTPEGAAPDSGPALPLFNAMLEALPKKILTQLDVPALTHAGQKHLQAFIPQAEAESLPQWPSPETAFTPEITDPDSLVQYDLAALLVTEIEALQSISNNKDLLEELRTTLTRRIFSDFWSEKRKSLLDKTPQGDFARRVTSGSLIPLLWNSLSKPQTSALRNSLRNSDELCADTGIRQWQPKKEDPVSPPVHPATQHLFLPLLEKLPAELAALLSADWHRSLKDDPGYLQPETAALQIRLLPFANSINPHLEKYPAWVRSMEKHRQTIVTVAAVLLFLIPASFGIYFTFRSDYNFKDELLEAGAAQTLVTMGDLNEAAEVYTRLINNSRLSTRKSDYFSSRANIFFREGKYQEALDDYLQAIELDPIGNLYKVRWNLAQTYARLDRYPEAIESLRGFIDEYGEELPAFKRRAENAISLWQ